MKLVIIDLGFYELDKLIDVCKIGDVEINVSKAESMICGADKIIFPVSGDPVPAVKKLQITNLSNLIKIIKKPLLGIDIGMQLLCSKIKDKNLNGIGIFNFDSEKNSEAVDPGFFNVRPTKVNPLFGNLTNEAAFLFSNQFSIPKNEYTIAEAGNGEIFSAAINKNNFWGVMFKPELSGETGKILLRNFINYC